MNKHGGIKCTACGSENLQTIISYDGADWDSEFGEGSGFDCSIDLVCFDCGRAYPIARAKKESDVCDVKDLK